MERLVVFPFGSSGWDFLVPLLLFELTLHAAMESPNQVLMAVMILTGLYLPGEPWFAEGGDSCPFLCGNLWALLESLYLPVSMIFQSHGSFLGFVC
jgi:hypothetical protein